MYLGSRVLYGACFVERRGISSMWENLNSPIYAGLRLFYHAVFGLCWLLSIVFLFVSGSVAVDWLDPQQGLDPWGFFLAIVVSISLGG